MADENTPQEAPPIKDGVVHLLRRYDRSWELQARIRGEWQCHDLPAYVLRETDAEKGYTVKNGPLPLMDKPSEDWRERVGEDPPGGELFAETLNELLLSSELDLGGPVRIVLDGMPVEGGGWNFFLHRTPHTEAEYNFVMGGRPDTELPVVNVNWYEAQEFCQRAGLALPSQIAWLYAALNDEKDRPYPWGSEPPNDSLLIWSGNKQRTGPEIVGTRPKGASPYAVLDMAGNVWEWTSTPESGPVDPDPFRVETQEAIKRGEMATADQTFVNRLQHVIATTRGE